MGFRDWLPWAGRRESRSLSLSQFTQLGLLNERTSSGERVDEKNALTLSAYWSGVNLISSAIAKLPRKVYRKKPDGEREELPNHGAAWLVQDQPNEFMVPLTFWRTLMGHVLTWGNGYAEIERDRAGRPIALWTIAPDTITPTVRAGRLVYLYKQESEPIPAQDILHVAGLGFDGLRGYSVVQMAKQSIGSGLALEKYGAAFFGNGAFPGVVLEHPDKLTPEIIARIKESWEALHKGADMAHRTAILEEGMKANVVSVPAKDAQLIESREVNVLDMARWLNMNPALLGYKTAERPGGNYESSRLDFLDNTLDPWLVLIEQECNRKLISREQRGTYYVEHVRAAVLRTDAKTRVVVQKAYVDMGVLTPEDVAKQENFPKPKPAAEPPAPVAKAEPQPSPAPADPTRGLRPVVASLAARFGRREAEKVRRAAKRGPAAFEQWVQEFYAREVDVLAGMLQPIVALRLALAGEADDDDAARSRGLAAGYVERSRRELLALRAQDLEAQADTLLKRWEEVRPMELADAVVAVVWKGEANA